MSKPAAAGQDLAHGDQLAGVVGAVQHERDQSAPCCRSWRSPGRCRRRSARTLMRTFSQLVAVDQVVAAAAFDDVAAVAAEDDVAGAERRSRRRRAAPADQRSAPTLVSTPPVAPPWLRIVTASTSSPRRMSAKVEPDRPSTSAKRSRIDAGEAADRLKRRCRVGDLAVRLRKAARSGRR